MVLCCAALYGLFGLGVFLVVRYLFGRFLSVGNLSSKAVFITGCDTGFGHQLALKCARKGLTVFAGCLTEKGGDELKKSSVGSPGRVEVVSLNVTSQHSVDKAVATVKEKLNGKGLWGLVNNAGIAGNTAMDDFCTVANYQELLDVNTLGVIRVTQALKPLVKKTKGRIVTVASVMGRVYAAGAGPYVMSKYACEAYCDCLRLEMVPFKVSVHILEPGVFKTNLTNPDQILDSLHKMWDQAPQDVRDQYGEEYVSQMGVAIPKLMDQVANPHLEYVVDAYYHALTSLFPRKRYYVGWDSLLFFIPLSMMPTCVVDWALLKMNQYTGIPPPKYPHRV
jgi:NAD(P)-dependent dehydrogenase (short-subunit alcohol dehydrogenase family)